MKNGRSPCGYTITCLPATVISPLRKVETIVTNRLVAE
jgi:hypothetical protein